MKSKARDPLMVAIIFFALLILALILYLASAAVDMRSARKPAPPQHWIPPGWVAPTSPPPNNPSP